LRCYQPLRDGALPSKLCTSSLFVDDRGDGLNIVIIDDHPLFSSSIVATLTPHYPSTSFDEYRSFNKALPELQKHCPDLILLDLDLPNIHGLDALKQILTLYSDAIVLMLSGSADVLDMQRCLDAGAKGYLVKTESSEQILGAIDAVLHGGIHLPVSLIEATPQLDKQKKVTDCITKRQIEVLTLMQQGKRNKEIANVYEISEATVKVHCRDLFRILGVNNRHHAVQEALRMGLLTTH